MAAAPSPSRQSAVVTVALAVVIAALAFAISYEGLSALAFSAGLSSWFARSWPLVVDGTIVAATVALWSQSKAPSSHRRYAWCLLFVALGVSVVGNVAHALTLPEVSAPRAVAAFVALTPPAALVAVTHLAMVLLGRSPAPRRALRRLGAGRSAVAAVSGTSVQDSSVLSAQVGVTADTVSARTPRAASDGERSVDDPATITAWCAERLSAGEKVTGTLVAQQFGVSAQTGRRRVAAARELVATNA